MKVDRQTQQLASLLKWGSEVLSTPFERSFKPQAWTAVAAANYWVPVALVSLYLCFCFFGQKIMRNYMAFDLRLPLAGWNAFLCLFSFLGMWRTVS